MEIDVNGAATSGTPSPEPIFQTEALRWLPGRRGSSGVRLEVQPDGVHVEVDLVVEQGSNMLEVASLVQRGVSESIEKMVGMPVKEVNVHIRDVL